jgi:hypothetical protein
MIVYRVVTPTGWVEFDVLAGAEQWRDANAPGAAIVEVQQEPVPAEPYRVSKDTMLYRVEQAGKVQDAITLIDNLPPDQQFLFTNYAWFWSDNAIATGMVQALGLDPADILAEDPWL